MGSRSFRGPGRAPCKDHKIRFSSALTVTRGAFGCVSFAPGGRKLSLGSQGCLSIRRRRLAAEARCQSSGRWDSVDLAILCDRFRLAASRPSPSQRESRSLEDRRNHILQLVPIYQHDCGVLGRDLPSRNSKPTAASLQVTTVIEQVFTLSPPPIDVLERHKPCRRYHRGRGCGAPSWRCRRKAIAAAFHRRRARIRCLGAGGEPQGWRARANFRHLYSRAGCHLPRV